MLFKDFKNQEIYADLFKGCIVNGMYMVLTALDYIQKLVENHAFLRKYVSVKLWFAERKMFYLGLHSVSQH